MYQPNDTIRLDVRLENETVWLSQSQMVQLFQRDQSVIARHISNVFGEGEVDRESNMHFLHIPFSDKPVAYYSLDVVISVGYRVKFIIGTRFRQWATRILRDQRPWPFTFCILQTPDSSQGHTFSLALVRQPPFPTISTSLAALDISAAIWYYIGVPSGYYRYVHA